METKPSFRELVRQETAAALKEMREAEAQRRAEIPPEALAWLALPPVWTLQLARACRFPTGETALEDLLARLTADGLCAMGSPAIDLNADAAELAKAPDPEAQRFWIPPPRWDEVMQDLLRTQGLPYLRKLAMRIGEAVLAAQAAGAPVLTLVAHWAALAAAPDAATDLGGRVTDLLRDQQPGMALQWIEAARPLARVLSGPLDAAVARAGRQLELYHRRARDERMLAHFLERPAQVAAFEALLDVAHPELWALHYAGFGGTGKTMLVRYLTARLVPRRGATLARVDFDYLNPDYPWRAPALLLDQWAQDLRLAAPDETSIAQFKRFDSKVLRLHERLTDPDAAPRPVAELLTEPDFIEVLEAFAAGVRTLPQPVVLLLDTCEELARLSPEGGAPQALSATFDIVEAAHALLPTSRVVFCGRRALAAYGAGWRCPDSTLPPRPYLRLHEVRGFSRAEAERYLREMAPVPPEFVEPILARSPDVGKGERFEWDEPPAEEPADARYNPFNLSLYADWVREDKSLTPETVGAAGDERYVELRIAGRIKQESLRQILPTVAALGRFDAATLQAVLGTESQTFTQLYEELANQEWIDRQPRQFLEVDRGLRPRLLAYYENTHPAQIRAAGASGAWYLRSVTLDARRELGNLDVAHFDGALRLSAPQDAAAWWTNVEARFARDQAYAWALSPLDMLLAPDTGPVASPEHPLHAAVLATYVAALLHTAPRHEIGAHWEEIARTADRHPDPAEAERLRYRALAGRIAATRHAGEAPDAEQVRALWQSLAALTTGEFDGQRIASALAAVEAVLEYAECTGGRDVLPDPQPLTELMKCLTRKDIAPEMWRWAAVITGRAFNLYGNRRAALVYLKGAIGEYAPHASRQAWLDWRVPGDLYARTRLEYLCVAYPAAPDKLLAVVGDTLPEPLNRDADRQAAGVLSLRGALRPWRAEELPGTLWQLPAAEPGELAGNAHTAFEPCGAVAAEALAGAGLPDLALAHLRDMGKCAEERADALDIVQAADRAMLRIVRRMRLRDEGYGLAHSLQQSWRPVDRTLMEALEGLDGAKSRRVPVPQVWPDLPLPEAELMSYHARWRSEFAGRAELQEALVASSAALLKAPAAPAPESSYAAAAGYLDGIEANHLARALSRTQVGPWVAAGCRATISKWSREHPDEIEEAFTLRLRAAVLEAASAPAAIKPPPAALIAKLGVRRAAEIALDEGELLALRLPGRAAPLLRQAREWCVAAGDPIGALLAGAGLALALARSGAREALRELAARLPGDYAAAAARQREAVAAASADTLVRDDPGQLGLVPLPDWATLAAHADAPGADLLQLQPVGWRPWLVRLIACLAWLRDADQPGTRARQLSAALGQAYGAKTETGTAFPAEFDGWLETTSGQAVSATPLQTAVSGMLRIMPSPQGPSDLVGRTVSADVQLQIGDGEQSWSSLKVARLDPYRVAAGALPPDLIAALQHVRESAAQAGGPSLIELVLEPEVSAPCWEGLITLALQAAPGELRFRRRVPLARKGYMPPVRETVGIVSFIDTMDSLQVDMVRQGWAPVSVRPGFEAQIDNLATIGKWYGSPVHVLHLVGTADQTSAGVRLQMSDPGLHSERIFKQTSRRSGLALTSEVARQFKELILCVLQATPFAYGERGDRDREQSAYLRIMAAELARQGVPAVLVLPSLRPDLAGRALALLAEALASGDQSHAALSGDVAVVAAMQAAIASGWSEPAVEAASPGPSEPDAALESALDVSLYVQLRDEAPAAA